MVEKIQTQDYLFRGELSELDPDVAELIRHETARQARYLIMIPSESTVPEAVREALSSAFHNIYAEGYPGDEMAGLSQSEILDYGMRLAEYRRNADNRYYKGTEYANIIESLARRRAAELFATNGLKPEDLFVNVQPLSGAPANNAVYTALLQPGDTIMSMDLMIGGHLSHGAPVNRTGKTYKIVPYGVDPVTQNLDYEHMMALALEHKPKIIIGGYSSFPLAPDWHKYRAIADAVGAIFLADVAHFAGLIAAGAYPSPVGIADILTFTTHKTLNGPRGAIVMTHRKDLAAKLDRGVFPGEQGGPHVNQITALAVALRFAATEQFRQLQHQTVLNARRLAAKLAARGIHICYDGTDSHMMVLDCSSITGPDGTSLSGDMAARILDLCGIVANRQTIPGDKSALRPSGVRLGTPWLTQRGFHEAEIDKLADIIADVLLACVPFSLMGRTRAEARAKIDFETLQNARLRVRELASNAGIDTDATADGYPHFSYLDDSYGDAPAQSFVIRGPKAQAFLDVALTSDVRALADGQQQATRILKGDGAELARGMVICENPERYRLQISGDIATTAAWLRGLSDGFILFDTEDVHARVPGPVDIAYDGPLNNAPTIEGSTDASKPYFIGQRAQLREAAALPGFSYTESEGELKSTPLTSLHQRLGAKMAPFAGYEMPLWYDKVLTEHLAVRQNAGIFDVTHMGVWDMSGPDAAAFLDVVATNDISRLDVGSSHYTFLLDPQGLPFDDLLIYRLADDHFFIVVNASNNDKNWAWLNAVKAGEVMIDQAYPARRAPSNFTLRDLRAESSGADRRVDIALQGPNSRDILLKLGDSDADVAKISKLAWAGITHVTLGGFDLIVSRTGYTGERVAYEVFPHPDQAAALFEKLVELGAVPCGLASRDSLRIEAGLPLYGHELAGPLNLNPADAGMGNYVKLYKPFFVGKMAFVAHEIARDAQVTRFRMESKGARPAHQGDPVVDVRGRVVGVVTSCSIDSEGYQLGHVYLKEGLAQAGTVLAVFAGSARSKAAELGSLKMGDKAPMPEPVVILSRFPKRKK